MYVVICYYLFNIVQCLTDANGDYLKLLHTLTSRKTL